MLILIQEVIMSQNTENHSIICMPFIWKKVVCYNVLATKISRGIINSENFSLSAMPSACCLLSSDKHQPDLQFGHGVFWHWYLPKIFQTLRALLLKIIWWGVWNKCKAVRSLYCSFKPCEFSTASCVKLRVAGNLSPLKNIKSIKCWNIKAV